MVAIKEFLKCVGEVVEMTTSDPSIQGGGN